MPRPREFDEEEAIIQVLDQFWRDGFSKTSTELLEKATGLSRSSLYNTFGGKRELFVAALDAYIAGPCAVLHRPLMTMRGAEALRAYLDGLSAFIRSGEVSKGCFMVNSTLEDFDDPEVAARLSGHFELLRRCFRRAIRQGLEDNTVEPNLRPAIASDWLLAVVRGVLAGAAGGEKPAALINALKEARRHLGI